jgi:hypothetical protein
MISNPLTAFNASKPSHACLRLSPNLEEIFELCEHHELHLGAHLLLLEVIVLPGIGIEKQDLALGIHRVFAGKLLIGFCSFVIPGQIPVDWLHHP